MKHTLKITLLLVLIFLAAQLVGLKVLDAYTNAEKTAEAGVAVYNELPYSIERPNLSPGVSLIYIVAAILVGTALALLLIRFKRMTLWKLWFFFGVFVTMSIAFSAFISHIVALAAAFVLALVKVLRPNMIVHNLTEIFIYGGLAAIFVPMLNLPAAVVLLLVISVYDMFAVWQTKHMVTLAKFQSDSNLFAGLMIPYARGKTIATKLVKPVKNAAKQAKRVEFTTAVLGGGDIAFPLLFAGVVMKQHTLLETMIIPAAAAIFLFFLLVKAEKKKFYPAMPFITAGCFVGYFLMQLI